MYGIFDCIFENLKASSKEIKRIDNFLTLFGLEVGAFAIATTLNLGQCRKRIDKLESEIEVLKHSEGE